VRLLQKAQDLNRQGRCISRGNDPTSCSWSDRHPHVTRVKCNDWYSRGLGFQDGDSDEPFNDPRLDVHIGAGQQVIYVGTLADEQDVVLKAEIGDLIHEGHLLFSLSDHHEPSLGPHIDHAAGCQHEEVMALAWLELTDCHYEGIRIPSQQTATQCAYAHGIAGLWHVYTNRRHVADAVARDRQPSHDGLDRRRYHNQRADA